MRKRTRSREMALQALYQLDLVQSKISEALESTREERQAEAAGPEVKKYAEVLVRGVSDKITDLDQVIEQFAEHWKINRMACVDRNILRLSAYEIIYVDDVPPKVAMNEAIELAKKFGDSDSPKFVNGILDKVANVYGKNKS